jgi:hypothetical protein
MTFGIDAPRRARDCRSSTEIRKYNLQRDAQVTASGFADSDPMD